jgi:hypothetical protein
MERTTCEIFLVVDADGSYEVGPDQDAAQEAFDNNIGGNGPRRVIKITAKLTPPQAIEAEIDISDEAAETKQVETEAA